VKVQVEQRLADHENREDTHVAAQCHGDEPAKQNRDVQQDDTRIWLEHEQRDDYVPVFAAAKIVDEERV
jgi:hypothetical protein